MPPQFGIQHLLVGLFRRAGLGLRVQELVHDLHQLVIDGSLGGELLAETEGNAFPDAFSLCIPFLQPKRAPHHLLFPHYFPRTSLKPIDSHWLLLRLQRLPVSYSTPQLSRIKADQATFGECGAGREGAAESTIRKLLGTVRLVLRSRAAGIPVLTCRNSAGSCAARKTLLGTRRNFRRHAERDCKRRSSNFQSIVGDGENLFRVACENDLEGIVAKRKLDRTARSSEAA
jgi:hypothetical protein